MTEAPKVKCGQMSRGISAKTIENHSFSIFDLDSSFWRVGENCKSMLQLIFHRHQKSKSSYNGAIWIRM